MFAPRAFYTKANLCAFYPDRVETTIDPTTPIGWYVMFPRTAVSTPVLIHHSGDDRYYGYSTKPNQSASTPMVSDDIRTGRCQLVWMSVEDAANSQYNVETGVGTQMDTAQFTGRIVDDRDERERSEPIDSQNHRMVYCYYTRDEDYIPDAANTTADLFINSTLVLSRFRHVPKSRMFGNSVFGKAVNLTMAEVAIVPEPLAVDPIDTISAVDGDPIFSFTVPPGTRSLTIAIDPAQSYDLQLVIDFGAVLLDSPIFASVELHQRSASIVAIVPPDTTSVTIEFPTALNARYSPELRYGGRSYPIDNWLTT